MHSFQFFPSTLSHLLLAMLTLQLPATLNIDIGETCETFEVTFFSSMNCNIKCPSWSSAPICVYLWLFNFKCVLPSFIKTPSTVTPVSLLLSWTSSMETVLTLAVTFTHSLLEWTYWIIERTEITLPVVGLDPAFFTYITCPSVPPIMLT